MQKKQILKRNFVELSGVIHNHSNYSYDSTVPLEKIISAAKKNRLDYLTINDHFKVDAKHDKNIINEQNIKIIVGSEIYDKNKNNHLLVFNCDEILINKTADEYLKFYHQKGAVCFIAHPFEKRSSKEFRTYLWTEGVRKEVDGIEIWNYSSSWMSMLKPNLNGFLLHFFPMVTIFHPFEENIKLWEDYLEKGLKVSAFGSADAHGVEVKKFGFNFTILKHVNLFKAIRTNVLIEEKKTISNDEILNAIKKGNSYIVNYKLGNPYKFYAGINKHNSENKGIIFGEEIEFQDNLKLYFRLGVMAKVVLIYNGKKISVIKDDKGAFDIKNRGRYRLVIYRFGLSWIYTNYFYVK